jgi:DNA-binding MurR/RpiR family transcriptional regulator
MAYSGNLAERITSALDSLSPKHKRMARFILDNRYFTSFASASQVGEKNDTSTATVVRFAQALGYEGYPELQDALRAELPSYMTAANRMQALISSAKPPASSPQQVFYTDIQNIERTAGNLSDDNLNRALQMILKARRIQVIGAGLSSAASLFLAHSLKVMGFDVRAVEVEGLQAAIELSHLQPGDLLIAIDLWRYVRMTVNAIGMAKQRGIQTIAITDSIVSPLAQMADCAFEIATEGVAHSLSVTALMSLLNVFVSLLADRVPQQVVESLRRVDEAFRSNDLLIMK